jgi:hypothetical protein
MPGTPARYVFLTLPTAAQPVLNLSVGGEHPARYLLNRNQLYDLNTQIADALIRGRIDEAHAFRHPDQLSLELSAP